MDTSVYWVGDIPEPLVIDVKDHRGRTVNLTQGLNTYKAVLIRNGREYIFPANALDTADALVGRLTLRWPSKSVFTEKGEYSLQLRMTGPNRVETTTVHTIRVKDVK